MAFLHHCATPKVAIPLLLFEIQIIHKNKNNVFIQCVRAGIGVLSSFGMPNAVIKAERSDSMKTVITVWNERIAPVFDVAGHALEIFSENGNILSQTKLSLPVGNVLGKVNYLIEAGIDELICGAVSRPAYTTATNGGIKVYSFIAGDISEVLKAYLHGSLLGSDFAMPGCGRKRGCRGHRAHGISCAGKSELTIL